MCGYLHYMSVVGEKECEPMVLHDRHKDFDRRKEKGLFYMQRYARISARLSNASAHKADRSVGDEPYIR